MVSPLILSRGLGSQSFTEVGVKKDMFLVVSISNKSYWTKRSHQDFPSFEIGDDLIKLKTGNEGNNYIFRVPPVDSSKTVTNFVCLFVSCRPKVDPISYPGTQETGK